MSPSAELTLPSWVDSAESAVLSTLRQEKKEPRTYSPPRKAWWTCSACPQRFRWLEGRIWYNFTPRGARVPISWSEGVEWTAVGLQEDYEWATVKRCKRCNRMRDRHHRAVRSLKNALDTQVIHMGTDARFVTLTVPNEFVQIIDGVVDPHELTRLVRDLKKKMYDFSRTVAYQANVIGAVEFYEQTYKIHDEFDEVEVNTHIHAVWLGKYWAQAELQDAWGGIVHLTRPRNRRTVMRYISKYVTKDPVPGTRAKETRGVLRG